MQAFHGSSCADPESFVDKLFFKFDEGMKDQNTTISWPSLARQQNAI